jgi:hypothetical protein
MAELTIAIDELTLAQLHERASLMGLSPRELVLKTVKDFLTIPEDEFLTLVQEILEEHAELYRRLA